ncbi:MAG: homoserine dehydrogenase [Gammaproteobacteria bacterium]|nr:homoserine dehydrogenase [Gammaproteobacteria bacterium]
MPLRIGLAGLGTVGRGVVRLLASEAEALTAAAGRQLELTRVASRTPRPEVDLGGAAFSTDLATLPAADDVDVVVEAIGGEDAAKTLFSAAVAAKKHVVTANKALIAVHGNELMRSAREAGVFVGIEAAVAGGIPIISALTRGLAANRIEWLAGIINGTSNYVLTAMSEEGQDFAAALREAQRLGYAEADPTFDVEGIDAAHKLAILASLAFGTPFDFDSVHVEGISDVEAEDVAYARELGYRIKHLGIARLKANGVEARVHPCLTPESALIGKVDGVMNAVQVKGHAVGSTLYVGPGAGAGPTASSIVSDLIELARGAAGWISAPLAKNIPGASPLGDLRCAHYLNVPAEDQPGVFADVAQTLSGHGISIEGVIQQPQAIRGKRGAEWVPIVILTDVVAERDAERAVADIEKLAGVTGKVRRIRVADLANSSGE